MVFVLEMDNSQEKYKLVPPDGGWGYLIMGSLIVMNIVTGVPINIFGIVFGDFLGSIGDETAATTLVNGVINTVESFTGLISSYLLQKYSYRKVGLIGAALYFAGSVGTVFVESLPQLIVSYGILEGLGLGLMMPATFSAFACYFEKKINVMMGISQTVMVLALMCTPPIAAYFIEYTGFRGSLVSFSGLALLNFLAVTIMQPVKWHMKKIKIESSATIPNSEVERDVKLANGQFCKPKDEPGDNVKSLNSDVICSSKLTNIETEANRKYSLISLGGKASSIILKENVGPTNRNSSVMCLDLSLLRDPKYLNITFGVAICFFSDVTFSSIIPLVLQNVDFDQSTVALMMMIFYGADLASRILISIISGIYTIKNRYIFLAGAFLTAIFRTMFTMYDSYSWKMGTLIALGFARCWIQTPLALVIAEEYKEKFSTAYSLYMVVCGVVSLIFGALTSFVKSVTKEDNMVIHVLTVGLSLCSIFWTAELLWTQVKALLRRRRNITIIT